MDPDGHATETYTDPLGRTVMTVYADTSFTETLYWQGGLDEDTQLRDAEGDPITMPSGYDGWTGIPQGGYVEVSIAQRKLGDPLVLTYDLYNAEGELTDVWQPAVVDGDPNSPTYGQSVMPHWHYGYDTAGNEITQTSPTGHNLSGGVTSVGNTTTFGFDQNGNQVSQTLPDNTVSTPEIETSTYNVYNQLASSTDFDGNTATYTYATSGTQAGDLLSVVYAGSGKATQTVTYTYDDLNRQQTVTDASGTTTSVYDREGDLIESETPEGNILYVFNLATGNHVETYTAYTDVLYGYDTQGRLTTMTVDKLNGTTLATPLVTSYTYDAAGNKLTETLPDGEVTTYTYNDLNELTGQTEVQGSTTLFSETLVLNDDGTRASALESQLQPDGSVVNTDTTWTYDADGRLTSETVTAPGATPSTSLGLATTIALPADYNVDGGTAVTLTWDGSNAYVSMGLTESQVADNSNAGEALFDPTAGVTYGGNGSDWVLVVLDQQNYDAQSFTLSNGTLTPDDVVTENRDFNSTPTIALPSVASGFDYEDIYTYDLDNNRVTSVHTGPVGGANETVTYKYNGDDELITQSSSLTSQTTTNSYDANGSLITSTVGGVTTTYTYDARNKMVGCADGTNTASYVYDDAGDRVAETANGVTTLYLTDTQNPTGYDQPIEQRTTSSSAPSVTYVLGDKVLAQVTSAGAISYLLVDGHGSTQQTTNASGVITATFRYDAFGTALNFNPDTAGTNILFGGDAIYDPVSGLYQHSNGRSTLGFLFTQMNPPGYSKNTDPISLQDYLYAGANPISNDDPTGDFTTAFGNLAHAQIGSIYQAQFPGTVINPTNLVFGLLKPDIFDVFNHKYAEIKPFTAYGISTGFAQIAAYDAAYGPNGTLRLNYTRQESWPKTFQLTNVDGTEIAFFNIQGIIFYTDQTDECEELEENATNEQSAESELQHLDSQTAEVAEEAGDEGADEVGALSDEATSAAAEVGEIDGAEEGTGLAVDFLISLFDTGGV